MTKIGCTFATLAVLLCAAPALHAQKTYKHSAEYIVAILDQNLSVQTGSDATLGKSQTDAKLSGGGQGIHLLHTDSGDYRVEAPVNKGASFMSALAAGMANVPAAATTYHNKWFLDGVQPGTKVLFAVHCASPNKKHPNMTVACGFWFPDPDSTTHEYATAGDFTPYIRATAAIPPKRPTHFAEPASSMPLPRRRSAPSSLHLRRKPLLWSLKLLPLRLRFRRLLLLLSSHSRLPLRLRPTDPSQTGRRVLLASSQPLRLPAPQVPHSPALPFPSSLFPLLFSLPQRVPSHFRLPNGFRFLHRYFTKWYFA